jgi:hypothetical protein
MTNVHDRLLWFLADPSLSDNEFKTISNLICKGGGDDIVANARSVRDAVRRKDLTDVRRRLRNDATESQHDDPLVEGVVRRLLIEANLSVRDALRNLADELGYHEPLPQKMSLQNGVTRLSERFNPSEILSAAQRIRNQAVHHSPDIPNMSWPLKRRENDSSR